MSQFEKFRESVQYRDLPIVVFTDEVEEQRVWHSGAVNRGEIKLGRGRPDVCVKDPVVMSPAYKGFVVEPYEERYLHYRGVGIVFARPMRGDFMQPSIDTILVCQALHKFLAEAAGARFPRIIDVGAGSGFIGKFAAKYASGVQEVCLSDIDSAAKEYWETADFGSDNINGVKWDFQVGDACDLLAKDSRYNLVISNPPYIPTRAEASSEAGVAHCRGFWEGCGLLMFLLGLVENGACPEGSHMVIAMTSLTLKSRQLCRWLAEAPSKGIRVQILHEREIAWKAWYAGRGSSPHLCATAEERRNRQQIGEAKYFVGSCEPSESRSGGEKNSIGPRAGYHWHVAYVINVYRERQPTKMTVLPVDDVGKPEAVADEHGSVEI
jgi:hypothetical protein